MQEKLPAEAGILEKDEDNKQTMKKIPIGKKGNILPGKAHNKKQAAVLGIFTVALAAGSLSCIKGIGQAYYNVSFNGTAVGAVKKGTDIDQALLDGRRMAAAETEDVIYAAMDCTLEETRKPFVSFLNEKELSEALAGQIAAASSEYKSAYVIRMGAHMVVVKDIEAVGQVLDKVRAGFDKDGSFQVEFTGNAAAGNESFSAELISRADVEKTADLHDISTVGCTAGASQFLNQVDLTPEQDEGYTTGLIDMEYVQQIEITPCAASADEILSAEDAIEEVTKEQEANKIYTVKDGDCLSVIAQNCKTSVDSIMKLNGLEDESAFIVPGDELIVAVPEAWLSVRTKEGIVYEEAYEAEPEIIENDSWYTTQEVVRQEAATGYREANAIVTYENGTETDREIIQESIITAAVPAIIEKGTKIPPTYRKPIDGGVFTSGFKVRWGRMHKGVDWSTPIGTPVYASSGGTVAVAGSLNGYGNCVYINHPDGRQTRYGHLSEILVSPGQSVSQGTLIAKSGNTGRSTGPHVHFEILINGTQVNPFDYMN